MDYGAPPFADEETEARRVLECPIAGSYSQERAVRLVEAGAFLGRAHHFIPWPSMRLFVPKGRECDGFPVFSESFHLLFKSC